MTAKASDPQFALDKLSTMVRILATHPGEAHERVHEALRLLAAVSEKDFTSEARTEYAGLIADLQPYAVPDGGYLVSSDVAARSLAGRVIDLWHFQYDSVHGGRG